MNNTFSNKGSQFKSSDEHHVRSHAVRSYVKKDGTFVSGFWRDGDGNTSINTFGGYFAKNPNRKR